MLTFISVKGRQSVFKQFPTQGQLSGITNRIPRLQTPGSHIWFWPRSAAIRCHYSLTAAKQPVQNELLVSVQFLASMKREKKNHCYCNWYGLAPWLEALNRQSETEWLWAAERWKKRNNPLLKASKAVLMYFDRTNWGSSPGCCLFFKRKEELSL